MSLTVSTVANYGGLIPSSSQNVKQFIVAANDQTPSLTYKTIDGARVQTPVDKKNPFYVATDLLVQGNIIGFSDLDISGNAVIDKDLYVYGTIYNLSDKRLKENVQPIQESKIDSLFGLNAVEYQLKRDNNNTNENKCDRHAYHYGFIAQEVEQIYPELVKTDADGYKTVNYIATIPLLLEKIKNMQKDIDELKQMVLSNK